MDFTPKFLSQFLNDTAIDSLSVLTPIELFDLPQEFFDVYYTINKNTGEIIDSKFKPEPIVINGIKLRLEIQNLFGTEYLKTVLSSKMLGKEYFNGICLDNFFTVFKFFKKALNLEIPYNVYLKNSIVFSL